MSRAFSNTFLLGVFLLSAPLAIAAVSVDQEGVDASADYDKQIAVHVKFLDEIDNRIVSQKSEIREKSLMFHRFKQKPAQGPSYIWMARSSDYSERKDRSLKVLALGLKESVRDLDLLENRRIEAQAELEWIKIQQEEFLKQAPALKNLQSDARPFYCQSLPVLEDDKVELIQGFGMQKDAETDLEWNSLGWWLSAANEEVHSCAPATVVFVGEITGRGRVVMLDHGAGHLTVYANLNPATVRGLEKGQKIAAGKSLGISLDRLYFEYRRQGVATDPKEVLRAESLAKVAL